MKLAIIGSGRMGSAFATRTSHAVAVRGSHAKSGSAADLVRELGITRADDKALLSADVVFVAVPPAALSEVAADLKDYTGVVVSIIVPGAGGMTLAQQGASAAEQLAELLPKASVVAAFTSISSVLIRTPSSSDKPTVFTCADDENARQTVIGLAEDIGECEADRDRPRGGYRLRGRRCGLAGCVWRRRAPRHDRLSPRLWRGPRQSRCAAGLRCARA